MIVASNVLRCIGSLSWLWMVVGMLSFVPSPCLAQIRGEWVVKIPASPANCSASLLGMVPDGQGGCYIGYSEDWPNDHIKIRRYDGTGVVTWNWNYSGADAPSGCTQGGGLKVTADSSLVLSYGSSSGYGHITQKWDNAGNLLWKQYVDSGSAHASIAGPFLDAHGNIISVTRPLAGLWHYIVKVSPTGQLLTNGMQPLSKGGQVLGFAPYAGDSMRFYGTFNLTHSGLFYSVANFDSMGIRSNEATINDIQNAGIGLGHDLNPYYVSSFYPGIKLWKYDAHVGIHWSRHLSGPAVNSCRQILALQNGDVFIAGGTTSQQIYLAKADSLGNHIRTTTFDIPNGGAEQVLAIRYVPGGKLAIVGITHSGMSSNPLSLYFVALVDTAGNLIDHVVQPLLNADNFFHEISEIDPQGNLWICSQGHTPTNSPSYNLWKVHLSDSPTNLNGRLWYDSNANCIREPNDPVYSWVPIELLPGNSFTLTDQDGRWSRTVGPGTWNVRTPLTSPWFNSCGALVPTVVNPGTPGWSNDSVDFGMKCSVSLNDLQVDLLPSVARVGQIQHVRIFVTNYGTSPMNPTLQVDHDSLFTFVAASPSAGLIQGNRLTWQLPTLYPYQQDTILMDLEVPTTAQIGDMYLHRAEVNPISGDLLPANNIDEFNWFIRGPYDPNEKIAHPGGATGLVDSSETFIRYQINFQNTGNDTAFKVIVRDTLQGSLFDIASFRMGPASAPFRLDLTQDSVLTWSFDHIALPDSHINEPGSHGWLQFSIERVRQSNPSSATCNRASIYFDYNLPVLTPWSCIREQLPTSVPKPLTTSILQVFPNPASETVELTWPSGLFRGETRIMIQNLQGQLAKEYSCQISSNKATINVSDLPSGIYVVLLRGRHGQYSSKLVVQR